jgi:molybdate transport repressor ModE-like protein
MSGASQKNRVRDDVIPRAKLWLEADGEYVFGRGISEILKAVEETGSIKAAAGQLGKSYRFVWGKIKEAERALGAPLVRTQVGGSDSHRCDLTDLARELVRDFDALRERVFVLVRREFRRGLGSTFVRHRRR